MIGVLGSLRVVYLSLAPYGTMRRPIAPPLDTVTCAWICAYFDDVMVLNFGGECVQDREDGWNDVRPPSSDNGMRQPSTRGAMVGRVRGLQGAGYTGSAPILATRGTLPRIPTHPVHGAAQSPGDTRVLIR